jgi:hypothetical protein
MKKLMGLPCVVVPGLPDGVALLVAPPNGHESLLQRAERPGGVVLTNLEHVPEARPDSHLREWTLRPHGDRCPRRTNPEATCVCGGLE